MNRLKFMKIATLALFISAALQAITGIVLFFDEVFSSLTKFLQLSANLHKYNSPILVFLVAVHLYLNWGWVRANFFKK